MKRRRFPILKAPQPGRIVVRWARASRGETPSLVYGFGDRDDKATSRVVMRALEEIEVFDGRSLAAELEARGYDLSTLRFSIARREDVLHGTETPVPRGGQTPSASEPF